MKQRKVPHPIVLVDAGDDGMEEEGWVEQTVAEDEALGLIEPMNPDPDLCRLVVDGSATLRPDDPDAPEDRQWWRPCDAGDKHAVAFWVVRVTDS